MPQARVDPIVAHAFAPHTFTVTVPDDDAAGGAVPAAGSGEERLAATRATAEKELRELLPSRATYKRDVRWTWAAANDSVTVSDQRAAAFYANVLRRHRVIRAGDVEIRPAANAPADAARVAETRMNLDGDLYEAALGLVETQLKPALHRGTAEEDALVLSVSGVADYVRDRGSFLGAYDGNGAPSVVAVGIAALRTTMTMADLSTLVRDKSRLVRATALIFARFALPPEELGALFGLLPESAATAKKPPAVWPDAPVLDTTVVAFDDEDAHGPFRDFAKQLLFDDEVFEWWLPTLDPAVVASFRRRVALTEAVASGKHVAATGTAPAANAAPAVGAVETSAKQPVKKSGTVIAGFKSAAAMAKYFRKAVELAEQGGTSSSTNMGSGSIVVRSAVSGTTTVPELVTSNGTAAAASASASGGVPQGVTAKSREELMALTKQRRLDRLRGGAAAALNSHKRRAGQQQHASSTALPTLDALAAAGAGGDGPALWPSEIVGPMNDKGALDDLFQDKAQLRMLFSATVGPDDVEITF